MIIETCFFYILTFKQNKKERYLVSSDQVGIGERGLGGERESFCCYDIVFFENASLL